MKLAPKKILVPCILILSACSPTPEDSATDDATIATQIEPAITPVTGPTVEDLMTTIIMPNAEQLWRAVSYVATDSGITETAPQSDADWAALRDSANALIAAGDELQNVNREILTSTFDPATTAFQLTPDEVKQMLAEDPEPWRNYARQMQESTRMTLQAIEFRDLMGLVEFGAQINEACEGCHATYWYRPPGMMLPQ